MLSHLSIRNFAIASHIEIDFNAGMTVLTGETGAGKSILLDALGLALGDRADTSMVRHGESKAEISAIFDIAQHPHAIKWLTEHDLDTESQYECILRRVITAEGRSRAYINGQPCPLGNLKSLGEQLIDIHSQHEHQSLLQKEKHREILDNFTQQDSLLSKTAEYFKCWREAANKLEMLVNNKEEIEARLQVLTFQVEELDRLALQENEITQLEQEQKQLANAELFLSKAHEAISYISSDESGAAKLIYSAKNSLQSLPADNDLFRETLSLFENAQIEIEEAANNLSQFIQSFEINPQRLTEIDERLSLVYQLSRKHRCAPHELCDIHLKLSQELSSLNGGEQTITQLELEVASLRSAYLKQASKASETRHANATLLQLKISEELAKMSMQTMHFEVNFTPLEERHYQAHGTETIEFLISTNPCQPAKPIAKIASGGELSRISLAIQVVIAQRSIVPTMVFDEVDVGIGGGTAEIVGNLLYSLGTKGQVICVTHLAQVASLGDQHFLISKSIDDGTVYSAIDRLDKSERTTEIARMLGGIELTEQSLAHAREMLNIN